MKLPRKVYAIQHNVTKKVYIGSSNDLQRRYKDHINLLRTGKHHVEDMQKDFDEYGEDYSFQELDAINSYDEAGKEFDWMEKYQSRVRGIGYNYKDQTAPHPERKRKATNRRELHNVVDNLTDTQCLFVLTFLKRILGQEAQV